MRVTKGVAEAFLLLLLAKFSIAASWTFADGTVSVQGKGSGVGSGFKEKLSPNKLLTAPVTLSDTDTLKVILTTQEGKAAKRPHQAFLLLRDPASNLDVSYPLSIKESGKAKLDLSQKDIPAQFLRSQSPISASLVIASFGSSTGYNAEAFKIKVNPGTSVPGGSADVPVRYGKLPEIHHVFRSDPKSPNIAISFVFTIAALATLPILLGAWLYLGGNLNHLSKAMSDAPVSHTLFVGSIFGLEGILFMYYASWNLFQTLPVLFVVGLITFVSGSRALTEVQERRLAGLR